MHSDLPKVLHKIAGRPLLSHVIHCAEQLDPDKIVVVYGFGGEQVPNVIGKPSVLWARQAEQHGTGHAVQQAAPMLDNDGVTMILLGDVPLLRPETCQILLKKADQHLALLTVEKLDPTGYGRIVRAYDGHVQAIVEQKDASDEQRLIREVNSGIMAMPTARLNTILPM
jgi:bifunctional UDP-N-acetylglucosamine pyrophosphorylase/glucosamine-1-phosphate N-acetyltransferase